jgi:mevalonate pyrophosphate decarboxylase
VDGVTGVFFPEQTAASLAQAILAFEQLDLDEAAMRENARRFAPECFRSAFADLVRRHHDGSGVPA